MSGEYFPKFLKIKLNLKKKLILEILKWKIIELNDANELIEPIQQTILQNRTGADCDQHPVLAADQVAIDDLMVDTQRIE